MIYRRIIIGLLILLLLQSGCSKRNSRENSSDNGQIRIAVGIPPVGDFCRRIGGDKVSVRLLVPPGASPHVYQPTSDDMRYLSKADLIVLNGIGMEFWAKTLISAAHNSELTVVDLSATPEIAKAILQDDHDSHHEDHEAVGNPHVWLDPSLAKIQAETICSALIEQDPNNRNYYEKNLSVLTAQIDALDKSIKDRLSNIRSRDFITFHPAWTYFAKRYNLNQVAAIEEFPGKEPTSDKLKHIIDQVRELNIKVIFAEPQFSPQIANTIAKDAGTKVVIINPLESDNDWDYIKMMNKAVDQMVEALK